MLREKWVAMALPKSPYNEIKRRFCALKVHIRKTGSPNPIKSGLSRLIVIH